MQTNSNVELMNPKIDFAFKEIMLDVEALKGFLGSVLNINPSHIKEIIYKNTNMSKVHQDDKQSILDVRIMIETEKTPEDQITLKEIDIEMQMTSMATWGNRSIFYVAKIITEQVDIDQKYSNMKKAIGINILNFNYMKQLVDFHTTYHLSEDKTHTKLSEMIEVHLIELPKIPKNSDGTYLYKWAKFFTAQTREEFQMITQGDKYLEAAFKRLEVISQDEEKRLEYTARQKALYDHNTLMEENYTKGRAEGFSEGKAEGRAEGRAEGIAEGRAEGIAEGRAEGRAEGKAEGRAEGRAEGIAEGEANGRAKERAELIAKLRANGMSEETINAFLK